MNLIEGLQEEMNRVREIIKEYEHPALNGAGAFAAVMMKMTIKKAEANIAGHGDVIEGLQIYNELQSYTT